MKKETEENDWIKRKKEEREFDARRQKEGEVTRTFAPLRGKGRGERKKKSIRLRGGGGKTVLVEGKKVAKKKKGGNFAGKKKGDGYRKEGRMGNKESEKRKGIFYFCWGGGGEGEKGVMAPDGKRRRRDGYRC